MVANTWDQGEAAKRQKAAGNNVADQQLALHIYGSQLIGQNPALVQHGGGNTSCKVVREDLFGARIDVLHIKGSGHDLATIGTSGMPGVRLDNLLAIRALEALSDADMVNATRANMLDTGGPTPSVETLLHAYLPHAFINHTHATAMLGLANLPNAAEVIPQIFGDKIAVVPFFMPGFELAKAAAEVYEANPRVEGLILLQHGHFAFSDDAKKAYDLIIDHTNLAQEWLIKKRGGKLAQSQRAQADMATQATEILPILRGIIGAKNAAFLGNPDAAMPVMDLRCGANVAEFFERNDLPVLSRRGVATPDHVIRTKGCPLVLDEKSLNAGAKGIKAVVEDYITGYRSYFDTHAAISQSPKIMLNPAPNLAWIKGVGVVGISATAKAAGIAADLAEQNIAAMSYGQDCGGFHPVSAAQLFEMEYWSLEQAKLGKGVPPAMAGRVVMVTGGGGAIGLATAKAFAKLGANIFLVELEQSALDDALADLGAGHSGIAVDVTHEKAADIATGACCACFGGLDILVSNAGAAFSGEMTELSNATLRKSFELNFFAHQSFAAAAARVFEKQSRGGQILFNVSKQAVNPGKGFGAYGIPKAATFFLLRQLALELGPGGVRVNGVNADRIRSGLLDADFVSARAKARGVDEKTYMAGNLIRREVKAHHVADAFVALAQSERTTAHVMTVDGGNIEAALR